MLTKLIVRNFKRFLDAEIELGNPVVFIGPNNSGKTSALQALSLWFAGLQKWTERRSGKGTPEKRPGVTINRKDLAAMPAPSANLLWRDLHVRRGARENGNPDPNIRIEIIVEGVSNDSAWQCGFEFDYANEESLYCRPVRISSEKNPLRMPVPESASLTRVAYLPPMSGLEDREFAKQPGEIAFLIGQGRTAQVLRNLCWHIVQDPEKGASRWASIVAKIKDLFGIELQKPLFSPERSEITMAYKEPSGVELDISSSGRGLQQTLLLLAYLDNNPGAVLLLDEPDAHLEILRQRNIYRVLSEIGRSNGSQIVAASHSEVVLAEACARDVVVAFVGAPHRINDRGAQLLKSLREIAFEEYYQAEQRGWILYLEGSTDLAILQKFAARLQHPAAAALTFPFVKYIDNQPSNARGHFRGLREAKPDLVGLVLNDRLEHPPQPTPDLIERQWTRREIENYLCQPKTLTAYAQAEIESAGPLFDDAVRETRRTAMNDCLQDLVAPVALRDPNDPWWSDVKASTEFLDRLFDSYFKRLSLPNLMRKSNYHVLADFVPSELIPPEVVEVLDQIEQVAQRARPRT